MLLGDAGELARRAETAGVAHTWVELVMGRVGNHSDAIVIGISVARGGDAVANGNHRL